MRFVVVLALLAGCASPRAALHTSALPGTLDRVNADLRGTVAQIDFADGTSVASAERVMVREAQTTYTADRLGAPTRLPAPTADIVRITIVRGRASGGTGMLAGALPGALLALGAALVPTDPDDLTVEGFAADAGRALAIAGGIGLAVVGGVIGASTQVNRSPGRYVVVYEGPVARYLPPANSSTVPTGR